MYTWMLSLVLLLQYGSSPAVAPSPDSGSNAQTPTYASDGRLEFPAKYREWIYLSTGVDMSYSPNAMNANGSVFDSVFVNPDSYRAFVETGKWPDKTMLVLEIRAAGTKASINKSGHFQTDKLLGREVHVRDDSRFGDSHWAFFGFDDTTPSKQVPKEAACYSCHQQHGAVDTTFVQFYPTLLSIAKSKSTLSAAYLKDESESQKGTKTGN